MLGFGLAKMLPALPAMLGESREVDVSHVIDFDVYSRGLWQFAYRRETITGLAFEHIVRVEDKIFQGKALLRALRVALADAPVYGYRQREGSVMHTVWNRENFSAELVWRTKWLEAMSAAGKTMDRKLWRNMGLCLLEYIPNYFHDIQDPALRTELTDRWFDTVGIASAYPFAAWQRLAMRILRTTRSRTAAFILCRLPFAVKHLIHFGTLR